MTTDIWVASHTEASYMVITSHFIDATWQLRKLIIGFKNISDHKGATICNVLLECLAEWDIKRVFCITVDNATTNSSAMKRFKEGFKQLGDDALVLKGEFLHLRCATHILNLVVKECLQEIDNSVAAIRSGINFVRSSTNRLKSFEFRVETRKMTRGSLPLDVKTRWNSTYLMLEQAMKFRLAFEKWRLKISRITTTFWNMWRGKRGLDHHLQVIGKQFTASTYVTSHKIYNEIVTITRSITAISNSPCPDEELKNKALAMIGKLDKYWNPFGVQVEMNKLLIVASVFDPKKKMNLVNKTGSGGSQGASSQSQEQVRGEVFERRVLGNGIGYERMDKQETRIQDSTNELQLYLKENVENPKLMSGSEYDVLLWWRRNNPKFSVLSLVARDIFAMQVSSVASEDAFNTSGRILDPYRSCLTHYMIEVLMCTEQWLKCEIHINEKRVSTIEQMLTDVQLQDELMREFEPEFNL